MCAGGVVTLCGQVCWVALATVHKSKLFDNYQSEQFQVLQGLASNLLQQASPSVQIASKFTPRRKTVNTCMLLLGNGTCISILRLLCRVGFCWYIRSLQWRHWCANWTVWPSCSTVVPQARFYHRNTVFCALSPAYTSTYLIHLQPKLTLISPDPCSDQVSRDASCGSWPSKTPFLQWDQHLF